MHGRRGYGRRLTHGLSATAPVRRWRVGAVLAACVWALAGAPAPASAHPNALPDAVTEIKPSIVAVGTYQITRRPPAQIRGTGFAVADGGRVATNAHVLPAVLDSTNDEYLAVFFRRGGEVRVRKARRLQVDTRHDIALLAIDGEPLPALALGSSEAVREGELYAFTGFPIGGVLGLYPVTHRGIVSAITPIVIPQGRSDQLDARQIRRLRAPYDVFQMDATAYPGNSGSPLFHPETGLVVGVINSVVVKETKEAVLEKPSGITYAIPVEYLLRLMDKAP